MISRHNRFLAAGAALITAAALVVAAPAAAAKGTGANQVVQVGAKGSWYMLNQQLAAVGKTLYFTAQDDAVGAELWTTTGTGRTLVGDLVRGKGGEWADGIPRPYGANPEQLTPVGKKLYFVGLKTPGQAKNGQVSGKTGALYVTSGSGASAVKTWNDDGRHPAVVALAAAKDRLYFTMGTGTVSRDLWVSSGTKKSTKQIKPAKAFPKNATITDLVAVGKKLFFVVRHTDTSACSLWVSDGTAKGTRSLTSLYAKPSCTAEGFVAAGNKLYFAQNNFDFKKKGLWTSDGTPQGTKLVKGITARDLTAVGSRVFFTTSTVNGVDSALAVSNGTAKGTKIIKAKGFPKSGDRTKVVLGSRAAAGNKLVFLAEDKVQRDYRLWISDGTAKGTHKIAANTIKGEGLGGLTYVNGWVYFVAPYTSASGKTYQLWRTDGKSVTRETTFRYGGSIGPITATTTGLYFIMTEPFKAGPITNATVDRQLWTIKVSKGPLK